MSAQAHHAAPTAISFEELSALLEAHLKSGAIHLYCALRLAAEETGWCTRKDIKTYFRGSVNKVRAALDQLQQAGLIRIEKAGTTWLYAPVKSSKTDSQLSKTDTQQFKTDQVETDTQPSKTDSACLKKVGLNDPTCMDLQTPTEEVPRNTNQSIKQPLIPSIDASDVQALLAPVQAAREWLPPQPDFDPDRLLQLWARAIPAKFWGCPETVGRHVFELIHRHPTWNSSTGRVTQADLEQLVCLATEKRPDKGRLAGDPTDLLKKTPRGKARWQAILLYDRMGGASPRSPSALPSPSGSSLATLYQEKRNAPSA